VLEEELLDLQEDHLQVREPEIQVVAQAEAHLEEDPLKVEQEVLALLFFGYLQEIIVVIRQVHQQSQPAEIIKF
tara:strand:- start:52 stop:273 length:222 start_codon:yes stop_codon:yes gene_type:complete